MRKIYLDHIRWATVLLVVFYHVCYLFNGVGVPGGIPDAQNIRAFDVFSCMIYPWLMVLLFTVAGISARYALQKRTEKEFLRERTVKLLVPSTLGLFVIHWITGYLNLKIGGGLAYIPSFLVYPLTILGGIGPLWFIQTLFLFSCVLVLLRKLDRADRLWTFCGNAKIGSVLLLSLVIWGASQILNVPVLVMYRFGIYFAAFAIGYYVLSHESVQAALEQARVPLFAAALLCGAAYTVRYAGSNYMESECLQSLLTNLYLWIAVLAIIGGAKRQCGRESALTRYLTRNSYGIYILHYPVLISTCYLLHYHTALPAAANYLLAAVTVFTVTPVLNAVIRRIPVIRFAVLGQRANKTNI